MLKMLRNALRKKWQKKKAELLVDWASQFGLTVVRIEKRGRTEYLVSPDGTFRRLATDKDK